MDNNLLSMNKKKATNCQPVSRFDDVNWILIQKLQNQQ